MPIRSGLEAFILRAGGIFGDYRDRTVSGKIAETAVRLEQIHKVLRENDKMMLGGTPGDELSSTYMEFRRRHNKLEDQYMNTPNRLDYADVYLLNVEVRQFQKKVKRSCESEVRGSPIKSIRDATWQPTGVGSTTPANHTRKLSTMSKSSAYSHSGNVDEYRRKRRRSGISDSETVGADTLAQSAERVNDNFSLKIVFCNDPQCASRRHFHLGQLGTTFFVDDIEGLPNIKRITQAIDSGSVTTPTREGTYDSMISMKTRTTVAESLYVNDFDFDKH